MYSYQFRHKPIVCKRVLLGISQVYYSLDSRLEIIFF